MQINIQLRDLVLVLAILGYFFFPNEKEEGSAAWVGGPTPEMTWEEEIPAPQEVVVEESTMNAAEMLVRKEEILESNFQALDEEWETLERERAALRRAIVQASRAKDVERRATLERELRLLERRYDEMSEARARLLALERDQAQYEQELQESYQAVAASKPRFFAPRLLKRPHSAERYARPDAVGRALSWPVSPLRGISAGYMDAAYRKRFRMDHTAIDIPVAQGTEIQAPADGIVAKVHDRGFGYSTVSLEHEDGLVTLFGHVSAIRVEEGQHISRGEVIGLSGGRPGSRGAGLLTTGPHVHFEVHAYGLPIDPLYKLSPLREAIASAKESVIPAM